MPDMQSVTVKIVRQVPTGQFAYDQITLETEVFVEEGGDQSAINEQLAAWTKQLDATLPTPQQQLRSATYANASDLAPDSYDVRYPTRPKF